MAHLRYTSTEELAEPARASLVARVVAERGSLLHLYQMLLHSPPLAEGWLHYLTRVRQHLELPGDLRELVIMQVAHLNGAPYEAAQHAPIARHEGVDDAALAALPHWGSERARFTPTQQLAIAAYNMVSRFLEALHIHHDDVRDQLGASAQRTDTAPSVSVSTPGAMPTR